uniref:Uncharacterized protein n=1 Tax=Angiostrongylus cantonensis TaxID=6313 RepID=A0A0K0CV02_ANGCA
MACYNQFRHESFISTELDLCAPLASMNYELEFSLASCTAEWLFKVSSRLFGQKPKSIHKLNLKFESKTTTSICMFLSSPLASPQQEQKMPETFSF